MTKYVEAVQLPVALEILPKSCHESNSLKGKRLALSVYALRQSVGYLRNMEEVSGGEENRPHPYNGRALGTSPGGLVLA
jgi:hypothetical protein